MLKRLETITLSDTTAYCTYISNMSATTILEARYVDRAKLNSLLQSVFAAGSYSVTVSSSACSFKIEPIPDYEQMQGDTIAVAAGRKLTDVSPQEGLKKSMLISHKIEDRD